MVCVAYHKWSRAQNQNHIENEMAHAGMSDLIGRILIPMEKVVQVRNGKKSLRKKLGLRVICMSRRH